MLWRKIWWESRGRIPWLALLVSLLVSALLLSDAVRVFERRDF